MNRKTERFIDELRVSQVAHWAVFVALSATLCLVFAANTAMAGGHDDHHEGGEQHDGNYQSKIYGTVERLPQDRLGIWVVNGREIRVSKDTRIKEKHGKAEAGAYVEVEGNTTGKSFSAYEIEVKRSKRGSR